MFKTITDKLPKDSDYPARRRCINLLTRVLEGELYDHLPYSFHQEKNNAGEYVPLRDRRPSVKFNLCRTVVNDSVGMLFSEAHFPKIDCDDKTTGETLTRIIKKLLVNALMVETATTGSVGSVAIWFRVIEGEIYLKSYSTEFLTPIWNPKAPNKLLKIVEKYKIKGHDLAELGYTIKNDELNSDFWRHFEYDDTSEIWFIPYLVNDDDAKPVIDKEKSVTHGLGFVPWIWVKNLPGGNDIDGRCTFQDAIDDSIEIDYQLSQGGRGLKYASDPTLLIKEPAFGGGDMVKGGGNAITVSADGDAKLLEINGTASEAVINYVKAVRELAIESIGGNRMSADKISAAQSGRAMEIMNASLINLADKLRISYGEGALLSLLKMIIAASNKYALKVDGKDIGKLSMTAEISLRWPDWYPKTPDDRFTEAQALKTNVVDAGVMSIETAVKTIAADYDVEDLPAELALIASDAKERAALMAQQTKPADAGK